jgi:ketosteroid isomerase-like protein
LLKCINVCDRTNFIMKKTAIILFCLVSASTFAQKLTLTNKQQQDITTLIDNYSKAREQMDTVLLKNILTDDIDQLVSSGEWRQGIDESVQGMLRSSTSNAGTRKIVIDKMRLLTATSALVDTRYEIQNADGTERKMWSTFVVVYAKPSWKIAAIRNMLPH